MAEIVANGAIRENNRMLPHDTATSALARPWRSPRTLEPRTSTFVIGATQEFPCNHTRALKRHWRREPSHPRPIRPRWRPFRHAARGRTDHLAVWHRVAGSGV